MYISSQLSPLSLLASRIMNGNRRGSPFILATGCGGIKSWTTWPSGRLAFNKREMSSVWRSPRTRSGAREKLSWSRKASGLEKGSSFRHVKIFPRPYLPFLSKRVKEIHPFILPLTRTMVNRDQEDHIGNIFVGPGELLESPFRYKTSPQFLLSIFALCTLRCRLCLVELRLQC